MVRFFKRLFAWTLLLIFLLAIPVVVIFIGLTRSVQAEMNSIEDRLVVADSSPSVILAADGSELLKISEQYRKPFTIDDVPEMVQDAFVAAEDRRFWTHSGVDSIGLMRAVFVSAKDGRASQGGSTITMQIAKQFVNGTGKTADRKAKDIVLALELEKRKTKKQLLELYLKMAYFGEGAFGLASAAEVYFGKEIKELTLSEAAMLARCVRRPSDQNPEANYRKAVQNRDVVLGIMKDEGFITTGQYKDAYRDRPKIKTTRFKAALSHSRAPYFVDHVLAEVKAEFPDLDLKTGGYVIETTLRPDVQSLADKEVRETVMNNRSSGVSAGAFVLIDRNGGILAEVGGQNYKKQQFNVVTSGTRQPGSSFKPIVYSAALETGTVRPGQMISNAPISIEQGPGRRPWKPVNFSPKQNAGSYSIQTAIAMSINRPALHAYYDTGKDVVVDYAHRVFGLKQEIPAVDSLPLGVISASPLQMAEVYSVFALGGDRVEPSPIKRIVGPDGTIIKDFQPVVSTGVLSASVAQTMDGYLRGVVTNGTGRQALKVPEARGKTGTTNDHRDAWFCGYSEGLVAIAWVGNVKSSSPMSNRVNGGMVSVQFWAAVMQYAVPKYGSNPTIDSVSVSAKKVGAAKVPVPNDELPTDEDTKVGPPETDPGFGDPIVPDDGKEEGLPGETIPPPTTPDKPIEEKPTSTPATQPVPVDTGPKTAPPPKSEQMVDVELCADTGDLAGRYCPNTITRRIAKSKVPHRVCREHKG